MGIIEFKAAHQSFDIADDFSTHHQSAQRLGIAYGDRAGQGHRRTGAGHHVRRVGDRDAVVGTEKQFLNGSDGL